MSQLYKLSKYKTKIIHEDDWTLVKLFDTFVVAFNEEWIVLNTGGWRTQTTKNRMNQASNQFKLGYQVRQEGGKWGVYLWKDSFSFPYKAIAFNKDPLFLKR